MNYFPAPPLSILKRPPLRKSTHPDAGPIRPRRRPAPGESHEVVWSEATGQLIDVAASGGARKEPSAKADRYPAAATAGRILVVEDDTDIQKIIAELLGCAGFHVRCANDGEAGWDALRAERPDVLITDHDMPRLTGLDLLRRLRAGAHQVPVIFISGVIPWDEADLARLLTPGATLEKPFAMTDLLAKVRSFLGPIQGAEKRPANDRRHDYDRRPLPLVTRMAR